MARTRRYMEGTETTARVFRGLSDKMVGQITRALNQGAAEIVARAQIAVPVDDGDLRDSIEVVQATEIRETRRRDGSAKGVAVYVVAGTGSTAAYARVQEFGRASSGDHPGHAAQPFLFPAYWSVRRRVRNRIARAINAAAKEAARAR